MANNGVPSWLSDDDVESPQPTASTVTATATTSNNDPEWAQEQPQQPTLVVNVHDAAAAPTDSATPTTITPKDPTTNSTTENGTTSNAAAASNKTWGQYFLESFQRDGRLLLITLLIIILMNIPFVKWLLYPFTIFSTWIHELCHGLAAWLAGGKIHKLEIFPDTSGLAYTSSPADRRGFVASAGYQGTAVVGCLLLLIRRTKRGPRSGTMAIAIMMILSVILWIRNAFGIVFVLMMGLFLMAVAWKLPSTHMRNVYILLAVTCTLNAITSVHNLFGANHVVNGTKTGTDAHTMAEIKGGSAGMWATLWLFLAILLTIAGILFAIPGPDEVADFTCCGVCQDLGCFRLCNYPGQRILSSLTRGERPSSTTTTNEQ